MRGAFATLARPFLPRVANASDGVGSLFGDLTHVSLVYRTRPLSVSPSSATLSEGGSQAFTASPADEGVARSGPYVWSVNGVDVVGDVSTAYGTLTAASDGLSASYAAPGVVPDAGTFEVCVRRAAAPADRGCASVTIVGSFIGSWRGTIQYGTLTPQPVSMTVSSQTGASASGDLFVYYNDNTPAYNDLSAFTGVVSGSNLSFLIPGFVGSTGAGVNLTKSGDALDGTMAEVPGRTFTAHFQRVPSYALIPSRTPTLSRSASPSVSTSVSTSVSVSEGAAFGKQTP
jgi:hypothetical protein